MFVLMPMTKRKKIRIAVRSLQVALHLRLLPLLNTSQIIIKMEAIEKVSVDAHFLNNLTSDILGKGYLVGSKDSQ